MENHGEGTASLSPAFRRNVLINALHDSPPRLGAAATHLMSPQSRYKRHISERIRAGFQSSVTSNVLWVSGPAGVGKTTLMQSLADALLPHPVPAPPSYEDTLTFHQTNQSEKTRAYVGTSFFFSHENKTTDPQRFFTTLAYGLALRLPALAPFIQSAFNDNTDLLDLSLERQCKVLILDPIHSWVQSAEDSIDVRLLMIIDGLEKCDGGKGTHLDIIRIIHQTFSVRSGGVRWQWIISSRMEAWIHSASLQLVPDPQSQHVFMSLASDEDITTYIQNSLSRIQLSHPVPFRLSPGSRILVHSPASSLASKRDIETLRWQSGGYFAYAASLIDYIERGANNDERLREVVRNMGYPSSKSDHPFAKLDGMYHDILRRVPLGSQELTRRVLGAISLMQPSSSGDTVPSPKIVATLLEISFDDLCKALYYLHSVVSAPLNPEPLDFGQHTHDPIETGIHFYHKSFNEFLRDPNRSVGWSIDMEGMHADLAKCCLRRIGDPVVQHPYAAQKWFVHCWRTGMDTDAPFGMLPELYDFDYTLLPWKEMVDRYFVDWLLHLEELTMSEYLILNAGPEYSLEVSTPIEFGRLNNTRLPPRPTYILGFEPSKQVLLVPVFDDKYQHRQDVGTRIGPREEHWDWIRGFRVIPLSTAFEDVNVDNEDMGEGMSMGGEAYVDHESVLVAGEHGGENSIGDVARHGDIGAGRDTDGGDNLSLVEVGQAGFTGDTLEGGRVNVAGGVVEDVVEDEGPDISEYVVEGEDVASTAGEPKVVRKDAEGGFTDLEDELSDSEVVIVKSIEELDDEEFDWVEREEVDGKS